MIILRSDDVAKLDLKLVRNQESFVAKKKHSGTKSNYNVAINNFENFCMEKYEKVDIFEESKENADSEILDSIKAWINYNLNPAIVVNLFSRIKKSLRHRGNQTASTYIKEKLEFKRIVSEIPSTTRNTPLPIQRIRSHVDFWWMC